MGSTGALNNTPSQTGAGSHAIMRVPPPPLRPPILQESRGCVPSAAAAHLLRSDAAVVACESVLQTAA